MKILWANSNLPGEVGEYPTVLTDRALLAVKITISVDHATSLSAHFTTSGLHLEAVACDTASRQGAVIDKVHDHASGALVWKARVLGSDVA